MMIGGFAVALVYELLKSQTQQFDLALRRLVLIVI